jgi:hypothetical protein
MSPLERAARAAAEQYGEDWDKLPAINPVANGEPDQRQYLELIRAAFLAIREPDGSISLAAFRNGACGAHEDCWRLMIDEILREDPDAPR